MKKYYRIELEICEDIEERKKVLEEIDKIDIHHRQPLFKAFAEAPVGSTLHLGKDLDIVITKIKHFISVEEDPIGGDYINVDIYCTL